MRFYKHTHAFYASVDLAERNEIDCNDHDMQKQNAKVAVKGT